MLIDIWWLVPAAIGGAAVGALGVAVAIGSRATDDKLADEAAEDPNWHIIGAGDPGLVMDKNRWYGACTDSDGNVVLPRSVRSLPGGGGKPGRLITPDMIRDGCARLDLVPDYGPLPPAPAPEPEWTDWYPHDGGGCPIEWAGAGQYAIKRASGDVYSSISAPAVSWWGWRSPRHRYGIAAYRVLKSAIPPGWTPRSPASMGIS